MSRCDTSIRYVLLCLCVVSWFKISLHALSVCPCNVTLVHTILLPVAVPLTLTDFHADLMCTPGPRADDSASKPTRLGAMASAAAPSVASYMESEHTGSVIEAGSFHVLQCTAVLVPPVMTQLHLFYMFCGVVGLFSLLPHIFATDARLNTHRA